MNSVAANFMGLCRTITIFLTDNQQVNFSFSTTFYKSGISLNFLVYVTKNYTNNMMNKVDNLQFYKETK